jgi:two-component sensor histidine kinase
VILRNSERGYTELIISDNGPGIPEEVSELSNIGSGLGLVKALTKQLGGELSIRNRNGAELTVRFVCEEPG